MVHLNEEAPEFTATAFADNTFKDISLSSLKGKFVVLFFYPADFTFVCPTELEDMANNYSKFQEMGVEILSVSTDTHFVHLAWHNESERIGKIQFPMVADPTHKISVAYDVLRDGEGVSDRATFIIDPEGIVKGIEVIDEPIGRDCDELIRKIQALKFAKENPKNTLGITPIRSVEKQAKLWNENHVVKQAATKLLKDIKIELAKDEYPDTPAGKSITDFKSHLKKSAVSPEPTSAVPGNINSA